MSAVDQPLSLDEVDEIERRIDATFLTAPLPTDNRYTSRRAVLTACEDQFRLALLRAAESVGDPDNDRTTVADFVYQLDRYKYELKAVLDLIDTRLPDAPPRHSQDNEEVVYTRAAELVFVRAGAFAFATRVFSAIRAGVRLLYRQPDGVLRISERAEDRSYPALEFLLGADDEAFSPIPLLVQLFRGPRFLDLRAGNWKEWSPDIKRLVDKTNVDRGRVKYQFILNIARGLYETFDQDTPDLPADWRFPWGRVAEVRAVFSALQTRCFYHLMAIHYGATRRRLPGMGVNQICLEVTAELLTKDLACVAGLPAVKVREVLDALTYGFGTRNPDPALQPIVPIGKGKVLLAPFLILSTAWARNMLSLHARTNSASFDRQSHHFETEMVQLLAGQVPKGIVCGRNLILATKPKGEEVDLVLADPTSHTILLCELRWMIQPGDIREVLQRQSACHAKIKQALRKLNAVRGDLPAVLQQLKLNAAASWKVESLVVIDNFGGVSSSEPKKVPLVPRRVFERALSLAPDLSHLHAAFTTPDWLPREGADYSRPYNDLDLGGVEIQLPQFQMGREAYMRDNLTRYLTEAYARSIDDLLAQPW